RAIGMTLLILSSELLAQPLTNNLIFYASFSNSFNDVQGGLIGTAAGGATLQSTDGVSGGYLKLTNSATAPEQYVYYGDSTPATGDFSFQVWVRSANPRNGQAAGDAAIAANKDWDSGVNVGWVLAQEDDSANTNKFQCNMNTA